MPPEVGVDEVVDGRATAGRQVSVVRQSQLVAEPREDRTPVLEQVVVADERRACPRVSLSLMIEPLIQRATLIVT